MRNSKECEGVVGSVRVHAPLLTVCVCAHAMFSSCLGGLGSRNRAVRNMQTYTMT